MKKPGVQIIALGIFPHAHQQQWHGHTYTKVAQVYASSEDKNWFNDDFFAATTSKKNSHLLMQMAIHFYCLKELESILLLPQSQLLQHWRCQSQ